MGCKLSVHVVHPENLLKKFSPKRKKSKTNDVIVNNKLNSVTKPTVPSTDRSDDTYETIYLDTP